MTVFKIAEKFTDCLGGRYRIHGQYSGEELRDNHLIPNIDRLAEGEKLTIDLSDVMVCCSTLEEVFGGLVRCRGADVMSKVEVIGDDAEDVQDARRFMLEQVERTGKQERK